MAPFKLAAYRLPEQLLGDLAAIKVRDGIPVSEQVRRALEAWVESRSLRPPSTTQPRKRRTAKEGRP
jgi:hypothetical protein